MPKTKLCPMSLSAGVLTGLMAGLLLSGTAYAAARTWTSDATEDAMISEIRSDLNEKRREENLVRAAASPSPLPALAMLGEQAIVNRACSDGVKELAQGVRRERKHDLEGAFRNLTPAQQCTALNGTWDATRFRCAR